MKKIFNRNFLLLVIILIAALLRFYKLGLNPPALTWDEAAWGYNAYSLGMTGRDEFGRFLPLNYLESFGDFKPPAYTYLTILPVKIFGLNEFAVRFPSALFGTLTVLLTYFLVKEIFKNSKFAIPYSLFAAFLLAISPWHIMLSRAAFEANVATFFLVAGVTCFLVVMRKKLPACRQAGFLSLSAASFALSIGTFNTARIVAPLLLLGLLIGFRKKLWLKKKVVIGASLVGIVILLPMISFFLTPQARLRFKEVNIFSDSSVVMAANQEMANDDWAWWSQIIHNRRWGYFRSYLRHYFDHFKPAFLFIKGDGNPKFSTQDVGELYLWEFPFLVLGTLLFLRKKPGYWGLIFYWLLVGIIPAATARETPHALRIETTLPTWQILTAFGFVNAGHWLRKVKIKQAFKALFFVLFCLLLLINFIYFQHGYWCHYPIEFSGEWQYGYQPAIEFIKTVEDEYDEIWFTDKLGRPYIYFLFYLREDPQKFWQEAEVEREVLGFVKVRSFGKYHFFNSGEPLLSQGKALVIDGAEKGLGKASPIKLFSLLNGRRILKAYTVQTDEKN